MKLIAEKAKKDKREIKRSAVAAPALVADSVGDNPRLAKVIARVQGDPAYVKNRCAELGKMMREGRYARMSARRKTDVAFRLLCNLRNRTHAAMKGKGKSHRTMSLVGCTIPELKRHIEQQFHAGMAWENYGKWHIDHIRPCASFDLLDPAQQRACFHFSNLQPLWALENWRKNAKW